MLAADPPTISGCCGPRTEAGATATCCMTTANRTVPYFARFRSQRNDDFGGPEITIRALSWLGHTRPGHCLGYDIRRNRPNRHPDQRHTHRKPQIPKSGRLRGHDPEENPIHGRTRKPGIGGRDLLSLNRSSARASPRPGTAPHSSRTATGARAPRHDERISSAGGSGAGATAPRRARSRATDAPAR